MTPLSFQKLLRGFGSPSPKPWCHQVWPRSGVPALRKPSYPDNCPHETTTVQGQRQVPDWGPNQWGHSTPRVTCPEVAREEGAMETSGKARDMGTSMGFHTGQGKDTTAEVLSERPLGS